MQHTGIVHASHGRLLPSPSPLCNAHHHPMDPFRSTLSSVAARPKATKEDEHHQLQQP